MPYTVYVVTKEHGKDAEELVKLGEIKAANSAECEKVITDNAGVIQDVARSRHVEGFRVFAPDGTNVSPLIAKQEHLGKLPTDATTVAAGSLPVAFGLGASVADQPGRRGQRPAWRRLVARELRQDRPRRRRHPGGGTDRRCGGSVRRNRHCVAVAGGRQ